MCNRAENQPADYRVAHLGAIPFGIFNTSSVKQIVFQIGARGGAGCADRLPVPRPGPGGGRRPRQARAHCCRGRRRASRPQARREVGLDEIEALSVREGFDFEAGWRAIEPEDVQCIIYTSGTTGSPKAAQCSNRMIMSALRSMDAVLLLPRKALLSLPADGARGGAKQRPPLRARPRRHDHGVPGLRGRAGRAGRGAPRQFMSSLGCSRSSRSRLRV